MPDKRVVLVVSEFPVRSETFIVNKFFGLLKKGWDAHVVCRRRNKKGLSSSYARHSRVGRNLAEVLSRVHILWPSHSRFLVFLLFPLVFLRVLFLKPFTSFRYLRLGFRRFSFKIFKYFYLDAELIMLSPGLIHFEFGAIAVGKMYLNDLLSCKITVSFRGYDLNFSGIENPNYYSEVWKMADGIHYLGHDLWARAQKRGCSPDKNHVLIPPAINVDFFKLDAPHPNPLPKGEGRVRVLSVGRLEWKKGYEFAMQAIQTLKGQGIDLEYRIVGAGSYLEALAFCRHQLKLEDYVSFLGALSQEEIRNQLKWADLFLHAAVSEGFCNAVLEAQAMELPVVCTDADGLPENVADGETGFIVPRRNSVALAEKISQLVQSPDLRKRMGRAGRQRVSTHFQLPDQIKAFEDFYTKVLNV